MSKVRTPCKEAQTTTTSAKIPFLRSRRCSDRVHAKRRLQQKRGTEQILILSTTADISTRDLAKALEIRLLPKRPSEKADVNSTSEGEEGDADANRENETARAEDGDPDETDSDEGTTSTETSSDDKWQSPTDVPDDVLATAKRLEFTALPSDKAQDRQHAFRLRIESDGEIYVRVR